MQSHVSSALKHSAETTARGSDQRAEAIENTAPIHYLRFRVAASDSELFLEHKKEFLYKPDHCDSFLKRYKKISTADAESYLDPSSFKYFCEEALKAKKSDELTGFTSGLTTFYLNRDAVLGTGGTKTVFSVKHDVGESEELFSVALPAPYATCQKWMGVIDEAVLCKSLRELGILTHPLTQLIEVTSEGRSFPALLTIPFSHLNIEMFGSTLDLARLNDVILKSSSHPPVRMGHIQDEATLKEVLKHSLREASIISEKLSLLLVHDAIHFCVMSDELHLFLYDFQRCRKCEDRELLTEGMAGCFRTVF